MAGACAESEMQLLRENKDEARDDHGESVCKDMVVSAEDKGPDSKDKITINNNQKRLTPGDIEKMINNGENFAEENAKLKGKVEAKNALESHAYIKSQLSVEAKLGSKFSDEENADVDAEEANLKVGADKKQLADEKELKKEDASENEEEEEGGGKKEDAGENEEEEKLVNNNNDDCVILVPEDHASPTAFSNRMRQIVTWVIPQMKKGFWWIISFLFSALLYYMRGYLRDYLLAMVEEEDGFPDVSIANASLSNDE